MKSLRQSSHRAVHYVHYATTFLLLLLSLVSTLLCIASFYIPIAGYCDIVASEKLVRIESVWGPQASGAFFGGAVHNGNTCASYGFSVERDRARIVIPLQSISGKRDYQISWIPGTTVIQRVTGLAPFVVTLETHLSILAIILSAYPGIAICIVIRRRFTESKVQVFGCKKCGYDIRFCRSGVCSECGTPLPETQKMLISTTAE